MYKNVLIKQAPRAARIRPVKGSSKTIHSHIITKQQGSSIHWQNIVNNFDHTMGILSENHVSRSSLFHLFDLELLYMNKMIIHVNESVSRLHRPSQEEFSARFSHS